MQDTQRYRSFPCIRSLPMKQGSHLIRAFVVLSVSLALGTSAGVPQATDRPLAYTKSLNKSRIDANAASHVVQKRAFGKVQAAYFSNWGIYDANFQPTNIIPSYLTHIIYAFADVNPNNGFIFLTDSYADEQKRFFGDSLGEQGNNLYGCLKQLYLLKLAHRNLKVLLSVGGWTYSQDRHFSFVINPSLRATFVASAVQLIKDYGFDGIDIDFEYPSGTAQGRGLANLLTELRSAFDALAKRNGDSVPYQLTAAVPAGPDEYASFPVYKLDSALTYWNLMAYDYAGSWLPWVDNQANLYGGARTNISTDRAVKWYISQGATASKINIGIPLYGRAFDNTAGLGQTYYGVGPGTFNPGIYSYSALPLPGAQVFENATDTTSYSYNPRSREFVSYDTPHIASLKAQYVQANGLAGSMFWDLSTDKKGPASLVGTTAGVYANLDQTLNHIHYPNSKWDNIRNNMGQGAPSSTSAGSSSSKPPSMDPTPMPTSSVPSSGNCVGVAAWSPLTVYKGGQTATHRDQFSLSGFPNLRAEVTCRNTFMDRKVVDTGRRSGWFCRCLGR